jgi:IS30 family transposase
MKRIPENVRNSIFHMRAQGCSLKQIAAALQVTVNTVCRHLKRKTAEEDPPETIRCKCGRKIFIQPCEWCRRDAERLLKKLG